MTNEELLQDLKQFIEATVSQQVSASEQRMIERIPTREDVLATEKRLISRIDDLETKLDVTQQAIGEGLDGIETTLRDHGQRIHRLEHRVA